MSNENVLTLGNYHFPITEAIFRRIADEGNGPPGWEFNICTGPPTEEPEDSTERFLFANGVRFYVEGDPIPLPDKEYLTGEVLVLKEPFDPDSGEVYFTLYVGEHGDVSDLTMRFLEKRGTEYRITVTALAHHVFEEPAKLKMETWIKQLPSKQYGAES